MIPTIDPSAVVAHIDTTLIEDDRKAITSTLAQAYRRVPLLSSIVLPEADEADHRWMLCGLIRFVTVEVALRRLRLSSDGWQVKYFERGEAGVLYPRVYLVSELDDYEIRLSQYRESGHPPTRWRSDFCQSPYPLVAPYLPGIEPSDAPEVRACQAVIRHASAARGTHTLGVTEIAIPRPDEAKFFASSIQLGLQEDAHEPTFPTEEEIVVDDDLLQLTREAIRRMSREDFGGA